MGLVMNIDQAVRKGRDRLVLTVLHKDELLVMAVYLDERGYLKINFEGSREFKIERLKKNDKDICTRE